MKQRSSDVGGFTAWWGRYGRDLVTVLAISIAAYAVISTVSLVRELRSETAQRINETCRISETKQRSDVEALRRTYEYLGGLSGKQLAEPLNRAVLAGLPSTIREAETDDAPSYCDKPGVGLPEPDPKLPVRPRNIPSGR